MGKDTSRKLSGTSAQHFQGILEANRHKKECEVVRAGLRLLEEEQQKTLALRRAITDGLESGVAENFNPELHLKKLKKKR